MEGKKVSEGGGNHVSNNYLFCISKYLQDKLESNKIKYTIMKELMLEDNIKIFYGDDDNYLDIVYEWINKK